MRFNGDETEHGEMRFSNLKEPGPGLWYLLPEGVARVARQYRADQLRPWIAAGSGALSIRVPVFPRSTEPWRNDGDLEHERHGGSCGAATCVIDEDGRIRMNQLQLVDSHEFTSERWSCCEPSEDVITAVMSARDAAHRGGGRSR